MYSNSMAKAPQRERGERKLKSAIKSAMPRRPDLHLKTMKTSPRPNRTDDTQQLHNRVRHVIQANMYLHRAVLVSCGHLRGILPRPSTKLFCDQAAPSFRITAHKSREPSPRSKTMMPTRPKRRGGSERKLYLGPVHVLQTRLCSRK